jgi:hypothetical protein
MPMLISHETSGSCNGPQCHMWFVKWGRHATPRGTFITYGQDERRARVAGGNPVRARGVGRRGRDKRLAALLAACKQELGGPWRHDDAAQRAMIRPRAKTACGQPKGSESVVSCQHTVAAVVRADGVLEVRNGLGAGRARAAANGRMKGQCHVIMPEHLTRPAWRSPTYYWTVLINRLHDCSAGMQHRSKPAHAGGSGDEMTTCMGLTWRKMTQDDARMTTYSPCPRWRSTGSAGRGSARTRRTASCTRCSGRHARRCVGQWQAGSQICNGAPGPYSMS